MIDRTTRWAEAIPLPNIKAETVMDAFIAGWIARFGVLKVITTDRGVQFTSNLWTQVMGKMGIQSHTTTAYHPQSNGMVERFLRTLKTALRCALTSSTSWVRALPWVMLGPRNVPKEDLKTSSAEMLYGQPLQAPGCCLSFDPSENSATEELSQARSHARNFVPQIMNDRKFAGRVFVPRALRDASFVFVRDDTRKNSLQPAYAGTFQVLERDLAGGTFLLSLMSGPDRVSVSRLKPAFGIRHGEAVRI